MHDTQELTQHVATQYENYIYPEPIEDLETYSKAGHVDASAPKEVHWLYWPDGHFERNQDQFTILIAGCGANAAARYAYEHPQCKVIGIDLSSASLAHEEKLKQKHNLTNLSLHQCAIQDVATLGETFDFIECVGVLHHLPNPIEGLNALKQVLKKPHGVISLMLYGVYGRTGVYMMQDLFHQLNLTQSPEHVDIIKQTLKHVQLGHPLELFARGVSDFGYDAGIVDMFLHDVDHPFSVEQCLELTEASGLVFQGWIDNFYYYPEGQVPITSPIFPRLQALPEADRWRAMELYHGAVTQHAFYITHPERDPETYVIDFESKAFTHYIPRMRVNHFEQADPTNNRPAMIQRIPFPKLPLNEVQLNMVAAVNGERTIMEIIKEAKVHGQRDEAILSTCNFFRSLWRIGYMTFKKPIKHQ